MYLLGETPHPRLPQDPATVHTSLQIEIIAGFLPLQYIKYK